MLPYNKQHMPNHTCLWGLTIKTWPIFPTTSTLSARLRADPDHVDHPISVMYASGASHHYKNFGKLSKVRDVAVNLRHSSNEEHMLRQVGAFSCPSPVFCPVPSYSTFIMHCACLFGLRAVTVGFGAPAAQPLRASVPAASQLRSAAAAENCRRAACIALYSRSAPGSVPPSTPL